MKKIVYPTFLGCTPPVKPHSPGEPNTLELDLKKVFHWGFVVNHGLSPRPGTNPLFDAYSQLLDDGEELRFIEPGIGADRDSRIAQSGLLGRAFAMGVLNELYGYTWCASISNLKNKPYNGWTVEKAAKGNMPDWLVGNERGEAVVVEAKGTHDPIKTDTPEFDGFRRQVRNVKVSHNGDPKNLDTYIIMTRFVLASSPEDKPEMVIEDPPLEGNVVTGDDRPSLAIWLSRNHMISNLERIGQYDLIVSMDRPGIRTGYRLIWECILPGLEGVQFIGRSFGPNELNVAATVPMGEFVFDLYSLKPYRLRGLNFYKTFQGGFFDGVELKTVRSVLSSRAPTRVGVQDRGLDQYDFVSLLDDGNFVAPISLMRIDDYTTSI
jgi:hypothetical protein